MNDPYVFQLEYTVTKIIDEYGTGKPIATFCTLDDALFFACEYHMRDRSRKVQVLQARENSRIGEVVTTIHPYSQSLVDDMASVFPA